MTDSDDLLVPDDHDMICFNLSLKQPFCIVINGANKTVFYPTVDQFVLLEINNCTV